jgi:hypothetical protein
MVKLPLGSMYRYHQYIYLETDIAYFTNLFTVETYEAYLKSDRTISGFRETQMGMAQARE